MSPDRRILTLVTAADAPYERNLRQFLRNVGTHADPAAERVAVYDLGLRGLADGLRRDFPWCEWRSVDFGRLPPHAHVSARTYAWKPVVLQSACAEFGGRVLWLDSACLFKRPPSVAAELIERYHVLTLSGQSSLAQRCDPEILDALGVPSVIRALPERVAGVVGVDSNAPSARKIVERWRGWADEPETWKTRTPGHMPEQALLSLLVYEEVLSGALELSPGEVDISSANPATWISTRNKVPAWLPRGMEPLSRAGHALYKAVDQWLWRRRLGGGLSEAARRLSTLPLARESR